MNESKDAFGPLPPTLGRGYPDRGLVSRGLDEPSGMDSVILSW